MLRKIVDDGFPFTTGDLFRIDPFPQVLIVVSTNPPTALTWADRKPVTLPQGGFGNLKS